MELNYVVDITSAYNDVLMTYGDNYQVQRYTHGIDQISMDFWMLEDHDNGWIPNGSEMNLSGERERLYYLHDELGSVTKVIGENGKTSAHYNYDEFGRPLPSVKFDQNWPGPDNTFGYTGYQYDVSAGLWYAQARYYMPEIGRFISEDPWKGTIATPTTMNPYPYVLNNPLKYVDPLGLQPWDGCVEGTGHVDDSRVWLIHGTFSNRDTWTPQFREYISDAFDSQYNLVDWSGKNSNKARVKAAEDLVEEIVKWHQSNENKPIRLIGHSHGGNVAILAANLLKEEHDITVDTLITIGTPVREYQLEDLVGQHINVYNNYDLVQSNGGKWNKISASRTFDEAENIEVILPEDKRKFKHGVSNHSIMHSNKEIWEEYIIPLIK